MNHQIVCHCNFDLDGVAVVVDVIVVVICVGSSFDSPDLGLIIHLVQNQSYYSCFDCDCFHLPGVHHTDGCGYLCCCSNADHRNYDNCVVVAVVVVVVVV